MELGEVMQVGDAFIKMVSSIGIGAWLAGSLYLTVRNPWFAVLACGTVLGRVLLLLWEAEHELRARLDDLSELEKQVVALRTAMHEMSIRNDELERTNNKLAWRGRSKSNNSF
jgi:hypothetical protein